MATHSSILDWKIPCSEEPGGLQSMELQRVLHDLGTKHTHTLFVLTQLGRQCYFHFTETKSQRGSVSWPSKSNTTSKTELGFSARQCGFIVCVLSQYYILPFCL